MSLWDEITGAFDTVGHDVSTFFQHNPSLAPALAGAGIGLGGALLAPEIAGALGAGGAADLAGAGASEIGLGDIGLVSPDFPALSSAEGAALDAGTTAGGVLADTAPEITPEVALAAGGLGESSTGAAVPLIPTVANTAAAEAGGVGELGASPFAPGALGGGAAAAPGGVVTPASQELALGNPNLLAELEQAGGSGTSLGTLGGSTGEVVDEATDVGGAVSAGVGPGSGASDLASVTGTSAKAAPSWWQAGGGLDAALSSPLTRGAELALPLGFLGYNLIKGPPALPATANQATQNALAQQAGLQQKAQQNVDLYNQTAAQDINLANQNQVTPAEAAQLATYRTQQENRLKQQIANRSRGTAPDFENNSEYVQGMANIDQQVLAMQAQMIQNMFQNGLAAASAANAGVSTSGNIAAQTDATLMGSAQLSIQNDQAYQQSVSSALQAFGKLAALSAIKNPQTAATAAALS